MSDAALRRDRRRFLKRATFAAAALASAPAVALAAESRAKTTAKPKPVAAPASPAAPATPPAPPPISDDAKALAGVIQRRYGAHLTPEQLEAVTRQIEQSLQGGRRLRDVKFANGDEPDFVFKP